MGTYYLDNAYARASTMWPFRLRHCIESRSVRVGNVMWNNPVENPTLTPAPRAKWNTDLSIGKWVKDLSEYHRCAQLLQEWSMFADGGCAVQSLTQQGSVEDAWHMYNQALIDVGQQVFSCTDPWRKWPDRDDVRSARARVNALRARRRLHAGTEAAQAQLDEQLTEARRQLL
eukprot:3126849-Pyramimonas_sp.AAC.1